ncbi:hypothetical protein [Actinomadura parmotrematis]|uniref:Histidine kinase n=1 Tax=Actinomadura parmotrematis TaxID=2864039 RepID=A0ABS7FYP7_9ACTN|nr:hypothetical protein [Actinomadura parmotrematis]MBW8485070.1 hypothetical protein [Actinomadura parmotrematis]
MHCGRDRPWTDGAAPPSEARAARPGPPRTAVPPAPDQPEEQHPVPDDPTTPSGLPVRVPQTSLAPPLREDDPATENPPEPARSPADIKRIMGSYQRGIRRGREATAERSEGEDEQ